MFDKDHFIELVHGEPPLWDKGCDGYSNHDQRDKCWLDVARELYCTDWDIIDIKKKDARGKDIRNKWRHIRDEYFRQVKKSKSRDPAPHKEKQSYVWSEALNFFQNSGSKRNTCSNVETDEHNEQSDENIDDDVETAEDHQENNVATQKTVPSPTVSVPKQGILVDKTRRQSKLSTFQAQLLKKLESETQPEDPDRMFLLSVLPEYKELNDEEKLDFKLMTPQFFRGAQQKRQFRYQMPTGPQFDFNIQNIYQQQPSTSNPYKPPRSVRPPSTHSLSDQFILPLHSPSLTESHQINSSIALSSHGSLLSEDSVSDE